MKPIKAAKALLLALLQIVLLPTMSMPGVRARASHLQSSAQTDRTRESSSWRRVGTDDGDFSVLWPTTPTISADGNYSLGQYGPHIDRLIVAGAYSQGAVFITRIYETPSRKDLFKQYAKIFKYDEGAGTDLVAAGASQAKEYLKAGDDHVIREWVFVTKKRLYVVQTASRRKEDPSVRKFMGSVEVGGAGVSVPWPAESQSAAAPPKEADTSKVFNQEEVTLPAVIIYKPKPPYPNEAKSARVSGPVKFRVLLSAAGEVEKVEVVSGRPGGLSEGVVGVAKYIRFIPAEKDGRYVSQYAELVYNFNLR